MPAPNHSIFYRLDALPAAQPTASKHWRQGCTNRNRNQNLHISKSTFLLPISLTTNIKVNVTLFLLYTEFCADSRVHIQAASWNQINTVRISHSSSSYQSISAAVPDLISKPASHHCCCRSTGKMDGWTDRTNRWTLDRFMMLTAYYVDLTINIICAFNTIILL